MVVEEMREGVGATGPVLGYGCGFLARRTEYGGASREVEARGTVGSPRPEDAGCLEALHGQ
jgi:hypothetical protein